MEDREAIADLVYRYTEAIRNGRQVDCLDLFVDDATIEIHHADPRVAGRSQISSRFAGKGEIAGSFTQVAGENARIWPMIHNLRIALDGDTASSNCVMMAVVWPHGKEYVGEYHDTYRREPGGWKFVSRRHTLFGDTTGRYSLDAHAEYLSVKN